MNDRDQSRAGSLPEILRPLFWDHAFEEISWEAHRGLVVHRVMRAACPCGAAPSPAAMAWLRGRVSDGELQAALAKRRGRGLAGEELRWWARELGIPDETVREWIDTPERRTWAYLT